LRDARQLRREALYRVAWEATPAAGETASKTSGTWVVMVDRGGVGARLAAGLSEMGARCILVSEAPMFGRIEPDRYGLNPRSADDFRALFAAVAAEGHELQGVVMLWGLDDRLGTAAGTADLKPLEERLCGSALHLIQAAAGLAVSPPPRVILVTRGTQQVGPAETGIEPFAAPLWGLARTVALEHPELRALVIDIDPAPYVGEAQALLAEVVRAGAAGAAGGWQVALRGGQRFEARLAHIRSERIPDPARTETGPVRLEIRTPGVLDDLVLRPTERRPPGPGEVEVRVLAAGINFRDVLKALGVYPGDPGPLGDECAGIVSAVGPGVSRCCPGDEVLALAAGAFSTFALAPQELVVPKPAGLSFAEAASVPGAFLTAEYALRHVAGLSRGERVLIHAAAGGVGLAAVEVARSAGAEIFATAGSPEKRDFLRTLGVRHVMSSRSLQFVAAISEATGGEGVDVVLNSLAGEFIPSTFSVLKRGGRFVELGRTGIWTEAQVAGLDRGLQYHPVFFADTCRPCSRTSARVSPTGACRCRQFGRSP
jgi:myxalamid-type polyketide synthase MxaB